VKAQGQRVCSVCGSSVPAENDFCPVCLLRGAIENGIEAGNSEFEPIDLLADRRLDHYEILLREDGKPLELGRGAMGVTYKAIDVNLRCPVALKVIGARFIGDQAACQRFVREARAAASVRHPNVASVFHLGTLQENYFYAMEFVAGESLEILIQRLGRLRVADALTILACAGGGLEGIWKQNLIHRDIKPANIMVTTEEEQIVNAKLIDLGLAKSGVEGGASSEVSAVGTFAGTVEYASPEQFAGLSGDIRSDLYSLGIAFWEMLTGELPFSGTASELLYCHQRKSLPTEKLARLPQPVVALLEALLAKDPVERFQNPSQLLRAIPNVIEAIGSGKRLTAHRLRSSGNDLVLSPTLPIEKDKSRKAGPSRAQKGRWTVPVIAGGLLLIGLAWFLESRTSFLNLPSGTGIGPSDQSIAVLPFESLGSKQEDSYFVDGIQEEILSSLARVTQLKVISPRSVRQYRTEAKRDLRQIAQTLGVTNVLKGTVQRNGDKIRLAAELIDVPGNRVIWAGSYDRDQTDIFAIQTEIAQAIASKLNASLSPDEQQRIAEKPTDSIKAYDLYLKAKLIVDEAVIKWDTEALERPLREAVNLLERAVELDPNFALAYCASAIAHDFIYMLYEHTPERRALADAALNKALRLRRDLPEVHLTYAKHLHWAYSDYEAARIQLAVARSGLPNDSRIFALEADIDRHEGKFDKSIQEFSNALVRDPLNENLISNLALCYGYVRQYQASEQMFHRLAELAPDLSMINVQKAVVVDFNERGDTGAVEAALARLPGSQADDREALSLRLAIAITREEWQQAKELIERLGGDDEGEFGYGNVPVPVSCYSILVAVLRREPPSSSFAETREELNKRVQQELASAGLLSTLALIDALLGDKGKANPEAERAVELTPVSKDAMHGPEILMNVAAVHVWTGELEKAFAELSSLAKMPKGISYGELKCDQYWAPVRSDPRYEKILAQLAPKSQ
jgi:serine/threonine protein kinase/tetratricopeptide (TPR) repeat protein